VAGLQQAVGLAAFNGTVRCILQVFISLGTNILNCELISAAGPKQFTAFPRSYKFSFSPSYTDIQTKLQI
jgi:hypothetical protein